MQDDNLEQTAGLAAGGQPETSETVQQEAAATPDPEVSQKKDDDTPESETGEAGGGAVGDKPKKPTGSSKYKERLAIKEAELANTTARLAALEAKLKQPPPNADEFTDWEARESAMRRHDNRVSFAEERFEELKETAKIIERERFETIVEAHETRVAEIAAVVPDYQAKISNYKGEQPSPTVGGMVLESDKSALLALYLADRPDVVSSLNRMQPLAAAMEIGRISARLSLPQPKTSTSAPAPMGALKGGSSPSKDPSEMTMNEYRKFRESQG